jgi:uncharacterized C2H2 Zn-finger protein
METFGDKMITLGDNLNCEFCKKKYKNRSGLWKHKIKCSENNGLETFGNNMETNDYKMITNGNNMETNGNNMETNAIFFKCENCDKEYQYRQNLWRHKKKCKPNNFELTKNEQKDITDKEVIMMLIKDNSELKHMLVEQQNIMMKVIENGTHNTTNNTTTHTNSHNKAFNLNFFLNETCKNAMNITDFVNSIKLQLPDLIEMGDKGYVEGISKIIVKNLTALDETERPVHCTDKKRETIYIKDENEWAKEDDNKTKLRKVIKTIANKNIRLLPQFREKYPDYGDSESNISDKYSKMVIEAMGGSGNNESEKEEKIIKNISKATIIGNKSIS